MQQLGARVISVDKAPLDSRISALAGIDYRQESAFALDPGEVGQIDWLFCDVICYPDAWLALVKRWLEAGCVRAIPVHIKFRDHRFRTVAEFAAIPGSRILHLHHNKHELTWIKS